MTTANSSDHIARTLDELAEVRAARDLTTADYNEKRAAIVAQIKDELDALEAEYAPLFAVADEREQDLTEQVKAAVLATGVTAKGAALQAVFTRGRESWDGRALAGYAAAHPEVLAFQKIGEPSVSIRTVKA